MTSGKEWHQLPRPVAMTRLVEIRNELRQTNLFDTEEPPLPAATVPAPSDVLVARTIDGTWNDLRCPHMGAANTRFGRNIPLSEAAPDTERMLTPNPRVVSQTLFTRTTFQPATIVNLLAAAWIQFQVHDWFQHAPGTPADAHEIPLADGDSWPERPMRVPRTPADPAAVPGSTRPPAYVNQNSHWWDGSQVYGCTAAAQAAIRTGEGGRVRVNADGRLPLDPATGFETTGFTDNGWIGLSLLHALFALEHNAICAHLASRYPASSDEQLFRQARLINAALMAKIHTVEWTPAILPHSIVKTAMHTNWFGFLGDAQKVFPGLDDSEVLGGIPGSPTDHHTAPYSLTEEFVSVYRMHSLIPDDYTLRSAATGAVLGEFELPQVSGRAGRELFARFDSTDLFYSLGVAYPGALRLHNFPRHLQDLLKDTGERLDLATVDILRDRERGVPRYNQFRRLFHKLPVTSFEELTDNPEWAAEIKRVYNNDLEAVDLLVGLMCEPLPEGFGFSDTAFRVFVLMASRRLKSDRFYSQDYRPEVYTQEGIDWIEQHTMLDVLKRHWPGLAPALEGLENAFHPWRTVGGRA